MDKKLIVAIISIVLLSTANIFFYEKWSQSEMKYSLLKVEYLSLLEERDKCYQQQVSSAETLEECTEKVEHLTKEKKKVEEELQSLKELISSNPEKWTVRIEGGLGERLERVKEVIEDSVNSPVVMSFAEMIEVSNAIYINGEKFSFDYVEDQAMFGERDAVVNPEWFLIHRVGDCDDVAAAMATILKIKGYDVKFCVGKREGGSGDSKHAWVRVGEEDVDYRYCINGVCEIEKGYFGNVAEKCVDI